jgi:hypothetical protein
LFLVVFVAWTVTVEDPLGGEPIVTTLIQPPDAKIAITKTGGGASARQDGSGVNAGSHVTHALDGETITIIDGSSGKRQEFPIPRGNEQKAVADGADQRLLEDSPQGRIPKVAPGGRRPIDAYASAAAIATQGASRGPRIAIVVGGLGVSATVTADAVARLPPAVSLAFVPYGTDESDLVAQAREHGHEVLLQAAMEPFDYPDNDPGPRTLLTDMTREQNLERLHWQMSRFQGYVGITNLMGERFMTSEKALAPVLTDIAKRGLLFFEGGSVAHSLASRLAAAHNLPFTSANQVIDAVPTPAEIDRVLGQLEAVARRDGVAVGVATALPVSIDHIVNWAKGAADRGITLVPISVAALKSRSS